MTKKTEVQVEAVEKKVVDEAVKTAKVTKGKSAKKLTLAELKKESKKLDEQREATINIGGTDYTVKYDIVFRKTKQRALLEDTLYFFQKIGEQNVEQLEMASAYTSLLIVKHFTDLDVPDEIDEALLMLEDLVDMEAIGQIVNELPEQEVLKIFELLTKTIETVKENLEMGEEEAKLAEAEIQNKELLEMEDGDREEELALKVLAEREAEDNGKE